MLYYLCCKNKTCCLFSLQERRRRAACALFFLEIAWPKAPVTTAEWLNLLTVAGSGAPKKRVLLSFSCAFSFPHGSLKMIWAADQRAALTPVFSFPGKQHMLFNHVFVLLLKNKKNKNKKKTFCLPTRSLLGRKCVGFFFLLPISICSPPILWTFFFIRPRVDFWLSRWDHQRGFWGFFQLVSF